MLFLSVRSVKKWDEKIKFYCCQMRRFVMFPVSNNNIVLGIAVTGLHLILLARWPSINRVHVRGNQKSPTVPSTSSRWIYRRRRSSARVVNGTLPAGGHVYG